MSEKFAHVDFSQQLILASLHVNLHVILKFEKLQQGKQSHCRQK
jgi:hypothetical protein